MRKTIILFLVLLLSVLCVYADESNSSLNGNGYLQLKTYSLLQK